MFKPAPLSLTIAALLSAPNALAGTVTGTVIDPQQQPIENVIVHYHGKQQSVRTNANGELWWFRDGDQHGSHWHFIKCIPSTQGCGWQPWVESIALWLIVKF